ncbi:nucleotide sugar dehydrogenase [Devosia lacusdianchii]|uniref:nucleotide sugar dehydrogenase n=1 Tax=Devosia lacusdianchii TaxID=2917991 RepID=UPI001F0622A7|nr:nucleotide sugar dehydrogenase [Devosia sp. JXJ CY 41]
MDFADNGKRGAKVETDLLDRLTAKSSKIGIYGLGYVGLPLAIRFSEVGFKVVGFDVDTEKVRRLDAGESYIEHISAASIAGAVQAGFEATTDISRSSEVDALIICVPTPLNKNREPDMSFVISTLDAIGPYIRAGQVISLESTTYPGTTEEEIVPRIEARGFAVGQDVFAVYSPEREDPGNAQFSTRSIPKVCGGHTASCLAVGVALYTGVIDRVVPVSSTKAAELTKLLENIHRAVNIGLVNEMKVVADHMGLDIHEIIRAAATKPFGFVPYYPGPGLGGHCIPIDPFYLTWKAREYGVNTRFIELAGEINSAMPDYVISKLNQALNQRKKSVNGSTVLVLGIAYKKNVDDMRESPSVVLMEKLQDLGATVAYSDPHVPVFPKLRDHAHFDLSSVALTPESIAGFDCVLLATDHDDVDYDMLREHARLVIDTRGRYQAPAHNITKA